MPTNLKSALQHLGGMRPDAFLRDYWQKKPLLIRNAFPNFVGPLTKAEVFELASRDEAESRVFRETRGKWSVEHGPFKKSQWSALRKESAQTRWTLLIQDTQHFSYEAADLLAQFDFIGNARIDDLMVSYAVPGGGVGAHFDSYDVFLLQGMGQRRWQISEQSDLTLDPSRPVKTLKHFVPEQEWVLNPGDMLYLPPNVSHHGVAVTECMTWSIGFRAPSQQELVSAYLQRMSECVPEGLAYEDPTLLATKAPGEISRPMQAQLRGMAGAFLDELRAPENLNDFIGRYLTEPKSHVTFPPPEVTLSFAVFRRRAQTAGLALDLCSRCLFDRNNVYLNGDRVDCPTAIAPAFRALANARRSLPPDLVGADETQWHALYDAYLQGYLHLASGATDPTMTSPKGGPR